MFALIASLALALAAEPPVVAPSNWRTPAEERTALHVPDGYEVQLVAAEPDIAKPINMAFDARGRLWVTCSVEYPFAAKDSDGRDSVKILSDFGPDGRARKIVTYADGLNIPIGVLPYDDGAIVYSIPNLWRFRGGERAETREVLFAGFGHRDTHGMVNSLSLGLDGWVYANHGYANDSTVRGKDGSELKMNSGTVFRFRPDGSRVELWARGQVNPFGGTWDEFGNLYTACCHSKPITQVLRGAVYESFGKPDDGLGFGPAMVHQYRGSTALCGLAYYDADYFPAECRRRFFLGDVVNNCVNVFDLTWKGATPTATQRPTDFVASSDPWFRPVDIKLGPDGALYVADFYNRIIGHYEAPLTHPGRDRTSGRIWRIIRKDKGAPVSPGLRAAKPGPLLRELDSPNIAVRYLATHELVRRRVDAEWMLRQLPADASPTMRSHACWVVRRLGGVPLGTVIDRFPKWKADGLFMAHALRADPSLRVEEPGDTHARRNWLESEGVPTSALVSAYLRAADDQFTRHIALIAIAHRVGEVHDLSRWSPDERDVLGRAALGSVGGGEFLARFAALSPLTPDQARKLGQSCSNGTFSLADLLANIERHNGSDRGRLTNLVQSLCEGCSQNPGGVLPEELRSYARRQVNAAISGPDAQTLACIAIAVRLQEAPIYDLVVAVARDRRRSDAVRAAAVAAVTTSRPAEGQACAVDAANSHALREAAIRALGTVNSAEARTALRHVLDTSPAQLAGTVATALAATREGGATLCSAVEQGKASPRLLTDRAIRTALESAGLKDRVAKLTVDLPPLDVQIGELIRRRREALRKAKPDEVAGKTVFTKHCAVCHQIGGEGAKVGPQLDGIGTRGLDRLLEDVLDPSRNVDPTFRQATLELTDGRVLVGLIVREDANAVVIADAQGQEKSIPADQIERRKVSPLSAMPSDVGEKLPEADFAALMALLLAQRKQ